MQLRRRVSLGERPIATASRMLTEGVESRPFATPAKALGHAHILEHLHWRGASFETRPMAAPQDEVDW
jgi:hypothetical protein